MQTFSARILPKALAILVLVILYAFTALPELTEQERLELSKDFGFTKSTLYEPTGFTPKFIRQVHPQYERISAWISSVGASVALTDIDNNGLSNDIIHVDPRFNKVFISPAQGTLANYKPFELYPKQLPYDSRTTAPMGTLTNDFNEDGFMDVLVYYWGRSPVMFYQTNKGFQEVDLNPTVERWFTNAATVADFDGNGHLDILICNYFPDGERVLDAKATDHDQVMQHSMSRAYNGGKDHFFLSVGISDRKGAIFNEDKNWFKNIENPADWTLAVGAADLNDDLLPEIYFANDFGPDKLFLNQSTPGRLAFKTLKGERHLKDIRSSVLGKDSFKGMGVDFGDINNDGKLDIYVSNIADKFALQESHFAFINTGEISRMKDGYAPFINQSESLGLSRSAWSWDAKLADFNNDGNLEALQATGFVKGKTNKWAELQELAISNDELLAKPSVWPDFRQGTDLSGYRHNPFFVKNKSGRYFDVATALKIDQLQVTRGIALGDINRDGDLDFVVANQWEPSLFYANTYKGSNAFIGLTLRHPIQKSSTVVLDPEKPVVARPAIGSVVKIYHPDGRLLIDFVDGGNGHSGKNSPELLFGLGKVSATEKLKAEISWRDSMGSIQTTSTEFKPGWHEVYLPF